MEERRNGGTEERRNSGGTVEGLSREDSDRTVTCRPSLRVEDTK